MDEIATVAEAADRLGYHHLTCSEHVAVPLAVASVRGARYWDPLATFGYLAARTTRIRLATHVLVLGYHHPLEIAKRYGTLDRVCQGRLILGVGVGSLREEFELLGAAYDDRGARADDALRALRASLSRSEPDYDGAYFHYQGFVVDPCSVQHDVPIWIGGRTARSLRRAIELADGWTPFGLGPDQLGPMLARARTSATWERRATALEVVLAPERALDPLGDPERARRLASELVDVGATTLNLRFVSRSLAHYREQLEAMVVLGSEL
jgi:probable F420-dependent oxidoreductase